MTAQHCLNLLRQIRDASFATVDASGVPQVRIIDVMLVEEGKLYFCTARGKDFYHQLTRSGRVAITGMNQDYQMVRFSGKVRRLADQKHWIDRIFAENPSMNDVYPGESRYILEPFCLDNGQLEFFDLGKSPIFRAQFTLGGEAPEQKGFQITAGCVGCGLCAKHCPQRCISAGTPYVIAQEHCLHCGLCRESCPAGAIVKRSEGQ